MAGGVGRALLDDDWEGILSDGRMYATANAMSMRWESYTTRSVHAT